MRALLRVCLAAAALLLPTWAHAAGLSVVTTLPDLTAITREVGREHVKVTPLALPTQDPHFVDARPNLALDLSRADALVLVGLDLEVGWLPVLVAGSRNPRIQPGSPGYVDCSAMVPLLEVPTQKIERSMGDIHPGGNPHYLYDPRNVTRVAQGLAARLGQLDPPNAAAYTANAADFVARADAARLRWEQKLAPVRGQPVVTYHKSFPYLSAWLGFSVASTIEPKPGIPPAPANVAQLLGLMQSQKVQIILQEEFYPSTTAELVRAKTGARLVRLPGGTNVAAGETWLEHFEGWMVAIAAGMGA